ncbi:MAG: sulfurtransferase [Candidatus Eisenbacteria bacterium]
MPHPGEEEAAGADGQIEPAALATRLADPRPLTLLDVRNPQEWDIWLDGARLTPLPELPHRLAEPRRRDRGLLQEGHPRGLREGRSCSMRGFSRVKNLRGGILAWAEDVDPSVPRY